MFEEAELANPGNNILILEPVDEWKPYLEMFREDPSDANRLKLQTKVSQFAKTTFQAIKAANPGVSFFIERTVEEHIAIFLDGAGVTPDAGASAAGATPDAAFGAAVTVQNDFNSLIEFYHKWNYDPLLTKVIDLKVSPEECLRRISSRNQHGDSGITLEYLQMLDERYSRLFHNGALVFIGNIGSGKTKAIEAYSKVFPNAITFKERIDLWGPDLIKFKSTRLPKDLVALQCKIASCAEEVYTTIKMNPKKLILVERSVEENINVFVKPHLDSGFITQEDYDTIVNVWNRWNYDTLTRFICELSTPVDVCYNRVMARGQDGDSSISLEYLESLDKVYSSLPKKIGKKIPSLVEIPQLTLYKKSKVVVVTGNIGAGKSTTIRKLATELEARGKTVTVLLEPVEEWGDDLCRFKETGSVDDLITLQKNIASFSRKVYETLEGGSGPFTTQKSDWYLIERSNFEHLKIFCEPSLKSGFLSEEQYAEATADYRNYDFDKYITKIIHLDVPYEECYRRILTRGQDGDSSIDPGYIEYLGGLYKTLYDDGVRLGVELDVRL